MQPQPVTNCRHLSTARPIRFQLRIGLVLAAPQWRRKQEPKTRGFEPGEETRTRAAKTAKTARSPANRSTSRPRARVARLIDRAELRTQAELAVRSGLHPYRVSNILCLLRLHPAILAHIARFEAGTPNDFNERWLRPIARLPHSEQLAAVARRLGVGAASLLSQEGCG